MTIDERSPALPNPGTAVSVGMDGGTRKTNAPASPTTGDAGAAVCARPALTIDSRPRRMSDARLRLFVAAA